MNPDEMHLPPQAIEAEQSVLGSLMTSGTAFDSVVGHITSDDFYRQGHADIFNSIRELSALNQATDVVTVSEHLSEKGILENVGGLEYLGFVSRNTPNSGNVKAYAQIVHDKANLRRLIEGANEIISMAYQTDGKTADQVIGLADGVMGSIMQSSTTLDSKHIREYLPDAIDGLEQRFKSGGEMVGIPTGFDDIDHALQGLENGELYIVAARPGMGKTAFALNIVKNMGLSAKALFISMEMPVSQLINRIWASYGVDHQRIRSGKLLEQDWPKITRSIELISQSGIYLDETPALSVSKITAIAKKRMKKSGKMPIVIDYLQIMATDEQSRGRYEDVTAFSMGMKALAKTLDVPVVVLSQLSRNLESRPNKRPVMSDLRESGAIEQDAGGVIFLYRDEVYNKQTDFKGFAEAIIGKSRNGITKTAILGWEGEYQRFNNLSLADLNRHQNIKERQVTPFKKRKLK